MPNRPAARDPAGEICDATATSKCGCVYGRRCRRASSSVNQSVFIVTGSSLRSSSRIASSASSMRSRCSATGMPIMNASDGSAPGPTPSMTRPRVRWSSSTSAVGEHERVVVGQRADARAEADVLRALRRGRDEHLGTGDDLVAGRVVLADPRLVEAEAVEVHDQIEVALERERRVLADGMERCEEDAELVAAICRPRLARTRARQRRELGCGDDPVVQRLEGEPAGHRAADLRRGLLGLFGVDQTRLARGFGEQLGLAGALHRDEPPGRLVDRRRADGQQAVVRQDGRLVVAERVRDALALLDVEHDAGVVVEHGVVAVERARVLGERVERAAQRRPRLAVDRVGVGGRDHVGPGGVDLRVDDERGLVHRPVALDDLAVVVDEDQVLDPDLLEVHAERVHPEVVEPLGIAGGDVPGDALRRSRTARTAGTRRPAAACGGGAPRRRSRTSETRAADDRTAWIIPPGAAVSEV